MEAVFTKLLDMSLTASWLVLMVIALRFLLKEAPKWVHCCLWAMVAVRLMCPVSFESSFSLIPQTETVVERMEPISATDTAVNGSVELGVPESVAQKYPQTGTVQGIGEAQKNTNAQPQKPHSLNTGEILSLVWLWGMAVMITYAFVSYSRLEKRVSASIALAENLYLCDYIETPFILGIITPRIYLPSAMDPNAAAHVLAHERAHIRRKDHWWKPLGFLLLTIHWFNPILGLAYVLLCRDIELACDEKVIREMNAVDKKAYSEALLSCSVPRHMIAACPLAFGEVGVKERVKTVLNYKKPTFWIILLAVLALIVTAVCFLTDPINELSDPFHEYYTVEAVLFDSENLEFQMEFSLTSEQELKILENTDSDNWLTAGTFADFDLTRDNFDRYFWDRFDAAALRRNNKRAWRLFVTDPEETATWARFYYLLQQKDGKIYLVAGQFDPEGLQDWASDDSYMTQVYRLSALEDEPLSGDNGDPFGKYYRLSGPHYDGSISVSYVDLDTKDVFLLTDGHGLLAMDSMDENEVSSVARFTEFTLTEENFDVLFLEDSALGASLQENNYRAWEYHDQTRSFQNLHDFCYLLQQKDGELLVVLGQMWDAQYRDGESRIHKLYSMTPIESDDPCQESDSPFQWTLNLRQDHVEQVQITTYDPDGVPQRVTLGSSELDRLLGILNAVSSGQIELGRLEKEHIVTAYVGCKDENGWNADLDVLLQYDGEAVRMVFSTEGAKRYPGEENMEWIIRSDELNAFLSVYAYKEPNEDPFSDPENAHNWCRNISPAYLEGVLVTTEDLHYCGLEQLKVRQLMDILNKLPESAFEKAAYPNQASMSVHILCRNVWNEETPLPLVMLNCLDGEVYYTLGADWTNPYQTWKIDSYALAEFLEGLDEEDKSNWGKFASVVDTIENVTCDFGGIEVAIPTLTCFVYEVSEEGIRFRPEDQEGWVLVQYRTEPFAVCGTGLETAEVGYHNGEYTGVEGYYDGSDVWSFINLSATSGDVAYNVVLLNESAGPWVKEYRSEIFEIINGLSFQVLTLEG